MLIKLNDKAKVLISCRLNDDQGPLSARIYFPNTKLFELHDNGYIQYQSFKDQITWVDAPEQEAPEDRPFELYAPLVSTRHIDSKYRLTYQTVDIKLTPFRDIVAWRRNIIRGILQDTPQGSFYGYDIYTYTQQTLRNGMFVKDILLPVPHLEYLIG
jgi:hypothetical protein